MQAQPSKVTIIATGGTIAAVPNEQGALQAATDGPDPTVRFGLDRRAQPHHAVQVDRLFDRLSEDFYPGDWVRIAEAIASAINSPGNIDGVVVTHGSDTLAYTASAITFMLSDIPVPVVFTGALRPIEHAESDAAQNIGAAILVAKNAEFVGAFVVFTGVDGRPQITRANRTISMSSTVEAFTTTSARTLGSVASGRILLAPGELQRLARRSTTRASVHADTRIDCRVKIVKIYPGFQPTDLDVISANGCRGLLLELYHSGTASTRDEPGVQLSLESAIARCVARNILVFGLPGKQTYLSARRLVDAGLIPLPRLSLEAAFAKLICLLGQHAGAVDEVRRAMVNNLKGELDD